MRRYFVLIFIGLALLTSIFCKIDIMVSSYFFKPDLDFYYKDNDLVLVCFRLVPIITSVFGVFCFLYLIYIKFNHKSIIKSRVLYLLFALIIGPGLVINYALKEHWGRARPCQILEFGGNKAFTCPLKFSNECDHNCSFASGHASMGYYFSSLSYVVPIPYQGITFLLGIVFGSAIGFGRILQGGHFLSDVIFSGLITIITNHLCFLLWQKMFSGVKVKKPKHKKSKKV